MVISVNAGSLYFKGVLSSVDVTQDEKWLISSAHHGNQPALVLCESLQALSETQQFLLHHS